MSEGLNQQAPPEREGEKKYAVVRRAAGLTEHNAPDEWLHAVYTYAGDQCKSPYELAVFVGAARRYDLNPVAGEIFAFRTRQGFKVYAGRDGFVKAANREPNYNGHTVGIVHERDEFAITIDGNDVRIQHQINGIDRGKPIGGYGVAWGKNHRPVVILRKWSDWEYLWSDSKKFNWQNDPIGMAENRLIRAVLTRVVALGGLGIEGDQEDDFESWAENRMGKTTRRKVDDLRAKLGLDQEPGPVQAEGEVTEELSLEDLAKLFGEAMSHHGILPKHVAAWAHTTASVPANPDDWGPNHIHLAMQQLRDSQGRDFLIEYARELAGLIELPFQERQELEDRLVALDTDTDTLRSLIELLEERRPLQ